MEIGLDMGHNPVVRTETHESQNEYPEPMYKDSTFFLFIFLRSQASLRLHLDSPLSFEQAA